MAGKREISFLITGDAKQLAAAAAKAEAELTKLDNFKLKAKELGINYDSKHVQDQLAKINDLKLAVKYAKVDADVKSAEAEIQRFIDGTNVKTQKLSAIRMEIDRRHLDEQIQAAEKELSKLGTEAQQAFKARMDGIGTSMINVGKTMSIGVTAPIVAGFGLATKASSDLGEALDYTNKLLPEGAAQIHAFGETAAQTFGLSKVEVEKYAQSYATMLKGAGLEMEEVTEKSLELIKRTADIGSALNLTNDEVAAKLKSGLAGETEALRSIGIIIDEDAKKRYAWSKGIAEQGKNLTAQQKVIATFGLVMEKTTDQANNFGDTFANSLPNQMKASKAAAENTAASFGESLKPVMAEVFGVLGKVTAGFGELTAGQKQAIIYAGGFVAALGPIIGAAGNVAKAVGGLDTALNVFRNKKVVDGVTELTGGFTNVGKALGLLGGVATVAGGFLLLNQYMEQVEKRNIAKKFEEIQKALSTPNALAGEVIKLAEAMRMLDAFNKGDSGALKGAGLDALFAAGELKKFNEAVDTMLQKTGNVAGVQAIVDEMRKFGDGSKVTTAEIVLLEKKIKDYQQALYDAEVQQKASDEMNKKALETKRLEVEAEQKRIGAVKDWASATINAMTNVMRTEEQKEALAARLTENEKARYKGRDADLKAMEAAMPAARKWVQEQLDADEKVAESRKKLDAVKKESAKEEKVALKDISDARKDAAEQHEKDLLNQYNVYKEGKAAIKKAMDEEADVIEKAKAKESKAADDAAKIIKDADDKIIEAEGKMVTVIHDGSAKIEEAKRKVREAMADSDAAILKASNDYQQQLVENDREIEKSKERLAEVIRDSDRDILEAERDVADAVKDYSRDVIDAQRDVEETSKDVARNIADAEKDLARAIEDAAEKIADAKKAAAESAEDSAQRILDAEERLTGDRTDNAEAIADAVKDQAKVEKEGRKDVTKAEEDYAKAVAKSGANSEEAQNAAERLQEVRERAAENNEKAAERIAELQERAAKAQAKNEKDLQKAKDDAAEKEIENADRIADAERDAARQIEDANTRKDRAIQDGITANQAAQERLNKAQIDGNAKVIEAEENLRLTRERADRERDEATREHQRVVAEAEAARIEKSNEVASVVKENEAKIQAAKDAQAAAEKQWQIDLTEAEKNLRQAHTDRETALREANKLLVETQKQNVKDIATAHTNLEATIKKANENNRAAIDTTAKNAETAAGKISTLLDTLDEVRVNSADKIKTAEGGVTDAINDQKVKWGELKTEFDKFDVPTQKAIRSQIALIKGGTIADSGNAVPSGGLEQAMNDLIGDNDKGIKGITKAVNDIPPAKNIDITVTVNGKQQTIAQAVGSTDGIGTGGTGGGGSAPVGDKDGNTFTPGPNPTGQNVINVPGIGAVYVDPSWGGGNLNNGAAVPLGGVNDAPGEGQGNTNNNAFNGANAGGTATAPAGSAPSLNVQANVGAGSAPSAPANTGSGSTQSAKAKSKGYPTYKLQPVVLRFLNALANADSVNKYVSRVEGYGTRPPGQETEHDDGLAVDIFAGYRSAGGDVVKNWCLANKGSLGIIYVIWNQVIYSSVNWSGRPYTGNFSNGKAKSPHFDHVHVSFTGSSGGAGVDLNEIPVEGIPQNTAGTPFASTGATYGGISAAAAAGIVATTTTYQAGGTPTATATGTTGIQGGIVGMTATPGITAVNTAGTQNGIVGMTTAPGGIAAVVLEGEIARRRVEGAIAEERVLARRTQANALADYQTLMAERQKKMTELMTLEAEGQLTQEQKMSRLKEIELLSEQMMAAQAKVAAADEAKIAADRKAGVQTEQTSWETRKNGLEIEQEITRLRQQAKEIADEAGIAAGANTVDASVTAGHNIVDASETAGQNIVGAMNAAGQAIIDATGTIPRTPDDASNKRGVQPVFDGIYTWWPDGSYKLGDWTGNPTRSADTMTPAKWAAKQWAPNQGVPGQTGGRDDNSNVDVAGRQTGGGTTNTGSGTSSSGSGSGSSSDNKDDEMVLVKVLAPFIFQLDGKSIAEGLYEYTKLIARRNGDFNSDGTWRVTRR